MIRDACEGDAAQIAAIYAPIVTDTAISFELDPPDAAEMAARIAAIRASHPYLVATRDGDVIGYAYAGPHKPRAAYGHTAEVSIYIAEEARRGGVARALYEALFARLCERRVHALLAGITLPNPASVAFHEAFGFTHAGTFNEVGRKFGRWHDVGWWQRPLSDGRKS